MKENKLINESLINFDTKMIIIKPIPNFIQKNYKKSPEPEYNLCKKSRIGTYVLRWKKNISTSQWIMILEDTDILSLQTLKQCLCPLVTRGSRGGWVSPSWTIKYRAELPLGKGIALVEESRLGEEERKHLDFGFSLFMNYNVYIITFVFNPDIVILFVV